MTTVYSQLRVSCGLSAIINALQPETLKATMTQSFAKWLDIQWMRLTHNEDPADPLVELAGDKREFKWALVLDYILLRKIQSSFLLCEGVPPGSLILEVEYEHLDWNSLKPLFIKILTRLNKRKEDWPLWRYEGDLQDPEQHMDEEDFRKRALKLIQSIKVFWEIFTSNITFGPEGEWKSIFMNLVGFPQQLKHEHIVQHVDYYKTDFELGMLLEAFGFELDSTYGRGYPKSVVPNSIILINRPEHWVCEDSQQRGVVLDSLTQSTDSIHPGDSFNYFKPLGNLSVFRKQLKKLEKIFPDIEVYVEQEDLTDFPELELPETDNPKATAQEYHHSAAAAYSEGDYRKALLDKRVEVALLAKVEKNSFYYRNLLEFTQWCLERGKIQTAMENLKELQSLEQELKDLPVALKAERYMTEAQLHRSQGDEKNEINALKNALELYTQSDEYMKVYELATSLGAAYYKDKDYNNALSSFNTAMEFANKAKEKYTTRVNGSDTGPQPYWPAIIKGLENKIKYIKENNDVKADNSASPQRVA